MVDLSLDTSDLDSAPRSDRALDGFHAGDEDGDGDDLPVDCDDPAPPAARGDSFNDDGSAATRRSRKGASRGQRCAVLVAAVALMLAIVVFAGALSTSLRKPKQVNNTSQSQLGLGSLNGASAGGSDPGSDAADWRGESEGRRPGNDADDGSEDEDTSISDDAVAESYDDCDGCDEPSVEKCPSNNGYALFVIDTDDYAWEISWSIVSETSPATVYAEGPPPATKYEKRTRYSGEICLPYGKYHLELLDKGGDGVCCTYGNGKVGVMVDGVQVVETGDEDYDEREYAFVVPAEEARGSGEDPW